MNFQMIGNPPNIAVPTHYFKAVLCYNPPNQYVAGAFVLPNAPIPPDTSLESFIVDLDKLERDSGLTLFKFLKAKPYSNLCSTTQCILPSPDWWAKQKSESSNET